MRDNFSIFDEDVLRKMVTPENVSWAIIIIIILFLMKLNFIYMESKLMNYNKW